MLIEDLRITVSLNATSHSTSSLIDLKVQSASWSYAVNTLGEATISVVREEAKKPYYLNALEYKREDFVGKTIVLSWEPQQGVSKILFQGIVTGLRINKSAGAVEYGLQCSSGPLAMYNTTLGVKGWYPFGVYDDKTTTDYFRNEVIEKVGAWNSPASLMGHLVESLANVALINPPKHSQAARRQKDQVLAELRTDVQSLKEAVLLKTYWGNVGLENVFSRGIRQRIGAMVSVENPRATYWELLLNVCREIGVFVVPWISKTMIIPNMLFCNSTKNNVIFPSLMRSESIISDPFTYPDQIVMLSNEAPAESLVQTTEITKGETAIVFPDKDNPPDQFSPYAGNKYEILHHTEYPYLLYIYHAAIQDFQTFNRAKLRDDSRTSPRSNPATNSDVTSYKDYCQNFAEYYFRKIRAEKDVGNISMAFQPFLAPGFPTYIIDGNTGMNFRGLVNGVSHNVGTDSAGTSVSVGFLVNLNEQITFNSPLWQILVPSGDGIGPEILPESSGGALNATTSQHVEPAAALSSNGMDDETRAAEFTGRI